MSPRPTIDRAGYIGGTDIAAVVGRPSPWKTLQDVYLEKTGQATRGPQAERMSWGLLLEPVVIAQWARENGMQTAPGGQRVDDHCHAGGHADGLAWRFPHADKVATLAEPDGCRLLEVKCVSASQRNEWLSLGPPEHVLCQVQLYMAVYGLKLCTIIVLFGGNEMLTWDVPEDPMDQHELLTKAKAFWENHVARRVPPAGAADAAPPAKKRPPIQQPDSVEATEDVKHALARLVALRRDLAATEELMAAEMDILKAASGADARPIAINGKVVVSWQPREREAKVTPAASWMQFTVAQTKVLEKALDPESEKD